MSRITLSILFVLVGACQRSEPPAATSPATAPPSAAESIPAPAQAVAEGSMCGGVGAVRCAEGLYCAMSSSECQHPDAAGSCALKPEMCTQDYVPVCGCDGRTYGNACSAASQGVSVASAGECATVGSN